MIHASHILVLSDQRFAERHLCKLLCGSSPPAEWQDCTRGWGLDRRR